MASYFSRIVPVIDLMDGQVVHAIAGDRDRYRPISSKLVNSSSPRDISEAFVGLGFDSVYVADLDSIRGHKAPDVDAYKQISASGAQIFVDHGRIDATSLRHDSIDQIILGLESIESPKQIADLLQEIGSKRVIVSLDLYCGNVISRVKTWQRSQPLAVAQDLIDMGVWQLIVLDLSRVGMSRGSGTNDLIRQIANLSEEVSILAGGGVAQINDVEELVRGGCDRVLVSTALHQKKISPTNQSKWCG